MMRDSGGAGGRMSCWMMPLPRPALTWSRLVHTGLGSGTVLQCVYRLENWSWLESRWEDRDVATADGRPPRRFYGLTGVGLREARTLLAERFKGQLRFAPGGGSVG
jgi:hypothetical protein